MLRGVAGGAMLVVLAGCAGGAAPLSVGGSNGATTQTTAGGGGFAGLQLPDITGALGGIAVKEPPVAAYIRLARHIRTCWLLAEEAPLAGLKFHARTSTGAEPSAAITLLHVPEGRRRGLPAYSIRLLPRGEGAAAYAENHRLDEAVAARLRSDLVRWGQGAETCTAGAPVAAQTLPPKVAREGAVRGKKNGS